MFEGVNVKQFFFIGGWVASAAILENVRLILLSNLACMSLNGVIATWSNFIMIRQIVCKLYNVIDHCLSDFSRICGFPVGIGSEVAITTKVFNVSL